MIDLDVSGLLIIYNHELRIFNDTDFLNAHNLA
jgi:hypothetical protein